MYCSFFYSFGLFCLFKVISMFIKGGMICERKCEMPPPQRKSPDQLVHKSLLLQIEAILSSDHLTSPSRIGHPSHQMTDYHRVNPLYNVDIGPQWFMTLKVNLPLYVFLVISTTRWVNAEQMCCELILVCIVRTLINWLKHVVRQYFWILLSNFSISSFCIS